MKKIYEILKIFLVISWSLISLILLVGITIPTGKFLYDYVDTKFKQPFAEKTVQEFIKQYNNENYDYIYNNLVDNGFKEITSQEENKKEILNNYKKYGKIVSKEKGLLNSCFGDNNNYCYYITLYQKTLKNKFEMSYTFSFAKKSTDKTFKMYGYRYEESPINKWSQPVND